MKIVRSGLLASCQTNCAAAGCPGTLDRQGYVNTEVIIPLEHPLQQFSSSSTAPLALSQYAHAQGFEPQIAMQCIFVPLGFHHPN